MTVIQYGLPRVRNIFAIVSDTSAKRTYPWGEIDITNENHSDFRRLQRLLLERSKIISLKTLTQKMSMDLVKENALDVNGKKGGGVKRRTWIVENVFGITDATIQEQKMKQKQGRLRTHSWILFLDDSDRIIVFINELFVLIGWLGVLVWIAMYFNLPAKLVFGIHTIYQQMRSMLA